jgi:hypothetical protein
MQRIFQAVAWLLAGTIVVLSLSPPSVQPTTGAAHGLEHFLIFLATGIAFGFGYSRRAGLLMVALDVRGCDRGRGIGGVNQHISVDREQLATFNGLVQGVAVGQYRRVCRCCGMSGPRFR